jgi:hypothetical protein
LGCINLIRMRRAPQNTVLIKVLKFLISSTTGISIELVKILKNLKTKLRGLSLRANYTDCCLSAKLVPTFTYRGCHVVSVTDPYGRILVFLDRNNNTGNNSVALVIPTERPPLVGEVSANLCVYRWMSHSQHRGSPTAIISVL